MLASNGCRNTCGGVSLPITQEPQPECKGEKYMMCSTGQVDHPGSLVRRLRVGNRIWDHIFMVYNTGLIGGIAK